jgi:hypothetical protein
MSENTLPEVPELVPPAPESIALLPYNIALIVDGIVYQVLNVDGPSAAQYLSQPTFVQVGPSEARVGWNYDGSTFSVPDSVITGQ